MKDILIPLVLTMAFIVGVGLFSKGKFPGISTKSPSSQVEVSKDQVSISGNTIDVEIVDDEVSRREGLSGKDPLRENEGMLFVFDNMNISPSFWMKDMNFAIDIIWIDDGKIVQINENVTPPEKGTPDSKLIFYTTNQPVDYVLEVNAGYSLENTIKIGDTVNLPQL